MAPIFEEYVAKVGVADRLAFQPGSFFTDPLPTSDVVSMGHILHDWDLPTKQMLVAKAFDALPVGGALVVYEAIETPAGFDYTGIEARLRASADAGDPASATELAQFLRDPAKREAMLQSAVQKNYPPAVYKVATNLLIAVQRGQTTENVSAIRELLKIAGRTIPRAKLDLANCMAVGCDGHPADALTARAFGIDAARDGEPTAFMSMVRMPWGGRMTRQQLLAWQYFGDRLNEGGCMGDAYVPTSLAFGQTIGMLERNADPKVLEEARTQTASLWSEHGVRAQKENGCE